MTFRFLDEGEETEKKKKKKEKKVDSDKVWQFLTVLYINIIIDSEAENLDPVNKPGWQKNVLFEFLRTQNSNMPELGFLFLSGNL